MAQKQFMTEPQDTWYILNTEGTKISFDDQFNLASMIVGYQNPKNPLRSMIYFPRKLNNKPFKYDSVNFKFPTFHDYQSNLYFSCDRIKVNAQTPLIYQKYKIFSTINYFIHDKKAQKIKNTNYDFQLGLQRNTKSLQMKGRLKWNFTSGFNYNQQAGLKFLVKKGSARLNCLIQLSISDSWKIKQKQTALNFQYLTKQKNLFGIDYRNYKQKPLSQNRYIFNSYQILLTHSKEWVKSLRISQRIKIQNNTVNFSTIIWKKISQQKDEWIKLKASISNKLTIAYHRQITDFGNITFGMKINPTNSNQMHWGVKIMINQ